MPAGYCEAHRPPPRKDDRPSAASRGYGRRWRRYAAAFLAANPLCPCGALATDVDHRRPVTGAADPAFWDPDNHQALCHGCHARKTAADRAAGLTRNASHTHPP